MEIKALSKKKVNEVLDYVFETNIIHFTEDKWDINYMFILETIINELLDVDITDLILSDLKNNGINDVSLENKNGDLFNGTPVLRSNSHQFQVYYNYVNDEISSFSYNLSMNTEKNNMVYIGEL